MKLFANEAERLAHRQAGLIPQQIWDKYFQYKESYEYALIFDLMASENFMEKLMTTNPSIADKKKEMLWIATVFGHQQLTLDERIECSRVLNRDDSDLFISALAIGDKALAHHLMSDIEQDENHAHDFLKKGDFKVFHRTTIYGHVDISNRLIQLAENNEIAVSDLLQSFCFHAFMSAASGGHLEVFKQLVALAKKNMVYERMLRFMNLIFSSAVASGHPEIVYYLVTLAKDNAIAVSSMLELGQGLVFRHAVVNGDQKMMEYLLTLAKANEVSVSEMLKAHNFLIFHEAVVRGQFEIVDFLVVLAEENEVSVSEMLQVGGRGAFFHIISNHNTEECCATIDRIVELSAFHGVDLPNFLKSWDHYPSVLKHLVKWNRLEIVECLLEVDPLYFAEAEQHESEYGERIVHPFIENQLTALRTHERQFMSANPNGVFDLSDESISAELCFYLIRNLIRRSIENEGLLDDIRFLLSIPSVKNLAAASGNSGEGNELLRLAIRLGNRTAAEILLQIPAVREDAADRNHYQDEAPRATTSRYRFSCREMPSRHNSEEKQDGSPECSGSSSCLI